MAETGFEYKELPDGTIRITGGQASAEELVIPEKIGDKQVTEIGPMAFSGRKELKRVTLPDGLRIIQGNAFSGCESLEKVFLPEGLTELGDFAFNNCTGLNYIVIPTTLKKTGFNALTAGMLVLPPRSPLAASYRKDRYIYWDGKEPVEQLEERIAACKLKQKKHSRLVLCVVGLFFLFGFTMMAGLLLKIPRVLTVGWIGTAAFGIVIALMIRQDNQKNR